MRALKVYPSIEEIQLIDRIAAADLRTSEAAIRWLIRQEAERRGIILTDPDLALVPELEAVQAR